MLAYQNIYSIGQAQDRLRRGYRWDASGNTKDSDAMLVFTQGPEAEREAQHNLDYSLDTGRRYHADYLVLLDNKIQFVGRRISEGVIDALAPSEWRREYMKWSDSRNIDMSSDSSGYGEHYSLRPWRRVFANSKTRGVYEIGTGNRIKNRQDIIERFWSLGYATWRGRPLSVASVRWSGNREELTMLTDLAEKYWYRRSQSDVAKKMCSAYTAINRYAAWPGSW
jgi:hypothetical protein